MIPLAVIRPEPGCAETLSAARALGLEAQGFPLFRVVAVAWKPPPVGNLDALLAGSANVFRQGGPALAAYRHLPVHAVGAATAAAARACGFTVATVGSGGLQGVLDGIAPGTRLLRLAGAERVALTAPPGVTMTERTVYASTAQPMPADLARLLAAPAVVLLHSAEAARHLRAQCARLGLARGHIHLVCIGPRVAAAADGGWASVATAAAANETALLAKAAELCQT